ncbi:tryptophan synthase subunit alpha [Neptunicella marina]|uniref:Tryptophan synthase alpha chain n=1 Tax=Neptunicella marina TaxID=2125989 RepID=A0A8J6M2R3_9ALTE|nr:tryptophan synthase subunit alpha [Neptunicella marina]MBC3764676.1 tryptophan synthase subunit alpha [Neptunicella marina]
MQTSSTDRYAQLFDDLKTKQQGAFVPFVMLGDPDKQTSIEIILTLVENGADALELGFPFSDPIADGPTIQKAAIRALDQGIRPDDCFEIIAAVREKHADIPIGLLLYSNLVMKPGIEAFYAKAAQVGVDSILLADVPLRESAPFRDAAVKYNIKQILIAPPNASDDALADIAAASDGYIYLLGRAGVTGTESTATTPVAELAAKLNQHKGAPAVIGFGISKPEHVSAAIKAGAAGAIAGSATVNLIHDNLGDKQLMLQKLADFTQAMKAATL